MGLVPLLPRRFSKHIFINASTNTPSALPRTKGLVLMLPRRFRKHIFGFRVLVLFARHLWVRAAMILGGGKGVTVGLVLLLPRRACALDVPLRRSHVLRSVQLSI